MADIHWEDNWGVYPWWLSSHHISLWFGDHCNAGCGWYQFYPLASNSDKYYPTI